MTKLKDIIKDVNSISNKLPVNRNRGQCVN